MDTISSGHEGVRGPRTRWLSALCVLLLGFGLGRSTAGRPAAPRVGERASTAAPSPPPGTPQPSDQRVAQHLITSHWEAVPDSAGRRLAVRLNVRNAGAGPAKIVGVGTQVPGLRLLRATYLVSNGVWQYRPELPLVLEPAATVGVLLDYGVVDCALARRLAGALPITVMTPDGTRALRTTTADPYLDLDQPRLGQTLTC